MSVQRMSAVKRATGLAPEELAFVVAVMACERVHDAPPTRNAVATLTDSDDTSLPARLVRAGWLERAGTVDGKVALYRATDRSWRELGFAGRVGQVA
jgi:hypothetical protein